MMGMKQALTTAKNRYVPHEMDEIMTGVTMTIRKLKSQLEQVETALALARVRRGLISAGYNQGSGNQVAPNAAM